MIEMSLQMVTVEKRQSKYSANKTILVVEMSKTNNELLTGADMEKFLRDMIHGPLKAKLEYGSVLFPSKKNWLKIPDYEMMLFAHNPPEKPFKARFHYSYWSR
jgi:hypothetical protein